jgi:hypothetical protein
MEKVSSSHFVVADSLCGRFGLGGNGSSVRAALAHVLVEDATPFGVALGVELAIEGGEAVKQELRNVGEGDGIATRNAFAGELFDEIAEEGVDGIGGGEVGEVAEEFRGVGVVLAALLFEAEASVVRAKSRVGVGGEHAATVAFGIEVLTGRESDGFGDGRGGEGHPSPGSFCARM